MRRTRIIDSIPSFIWMLLFINMLTSTLVKGVGEYRQRFYKSRKWKTWYELSKYFLGMMLTMLWDHFIKSWLNLTTNTNHIKRKIPFRREDVIKWKHFPRYWYFLVGNYSHKNSDEELALMFSLICAWTNGWVNNLGASDMIRHRAHYDITVMYWGWSVDCKQSDFAYPTNRVIWKGLSWVYIVFRYPSARLQYLHC